MKKSSTFVVLLLIATAIFGFGCSTEERQRVVKLDPLHPVRIVATGSYSAAYVAHVELGDGHDYFVACNVSGSRGVSIVHAAGCRACKNSKE